MFVELLWLLSCVSYLLALKRGKRKELFFSWECITEFPSVATNTDSEIAVLWRTGSMHSGERC